MQKSLTKEQLSRLAKEINLDSSRLKEKIEKFKELDPNHKDIPKKKPKKVEKSNIPAINRFDEIVYRFKCPDCGSNHTKRTGLTTQREPKARFLCLNCQQKWRENKNVDRMFFTLSNKDIENIINNDVSLSKEKRDFFLDRYIIKK
jgi:transposase-like protein